jgi:hypothetical protein
MRWCTDHDVDYRQVLVAWEGHKPCPLCEAESLIKELEDQLAAQEDAEDEDAAP